jgi:hypothetical protein
MAVPPAGHTTPPPPAEDSTPPPAGRSPACRRFGHPADTAPGPMR